MWKVSVPLRGLSSWKDGLKIRFQDGAAAPRFSPLTGIKFVESPSGSVKSSLCSKGSFSPLTGIKFVERQRTQAIANAQVAFHVSVPLRGLSSWKVFPSRTTLSEEHMFQSPYGD